MKLEVDTLWQPDDDDRLERDAAAYVEYLEKSKEGPALDQLWRLIPRSG